MRKSSNDRNDDCHTGSSTCASTSLVMSQPPIHPLGDKTTACVTSYLNGQYGSTGTLSTVPSPLSSGQNSPSTGSTATANNNHNTNEQQHHVHRMSIDMDSEQRFLLSSGVGRESDSLTSDSSHDDDDYCKRHNRRSTRLQRLRHRASKTALYIENSFLTLSNLKVALSFVLWWVCYMFMGIFGGSVAYMHFPRTAREHPNALPDFGYDVIPYWCPRIPHVPHGNVQSVVLFLLYLFIFAGVLYRWRPRYHPFTGRLVWGGDGRFILQQLYHLNCLIFLSRTSTVVMTGLPQPNPKCVHHQHYPVTFSGALAFVVGRGFPPHACGDLVYSGHVGCTLICMAVLFRHGYLRNRIVACFVWTVAAIGIYFTISCRSHYSVDVVLAFYFGYFIPEWYFSRSNGIIGGRISRAIRWLEVRPDDLESNEVALVAAIGKRASSGQTFSTENSTVVVDV